MPREWMGTRHNVDSWRPDSESNYRESFSDVNDNRLLKSTSTKIGSSGMEERAAAVELADLLG